MEGINILNSYEALVRTSWGWSAGRTYMIIGSIIALILLCISVYFDIKSVKTDLSVWTYILATAMAVCIVSPLATAISGTRHYRTYYQVTVNEDVNFNDVMEKYEIIDQDGLILTLVDKSEEEYIK